MPERLECNNKLPFYPDPERKPTILLVEDEEYVREVAREILEIEGYSVLAAGHPHEALELYDRHGGAVDVLLTDVVMPGMDGHDLAERLAQQQPSIKTIFMSGYTENALLRRGVRDLKAIYLQKPFTLQSLVERVRQVLEGTSWLGDIQPIVKTVTEPNETAF